MIFPLLWIFKPSIVKKGGQAEIFLWLYNGSNIDCTTQNLALYIPQKVLEGFDIDYQHSNNLLLVQNWMRDDWWNLWPAIKFEKQVIKSGEMIEYHLELSGMKPGYYSGKYSLTGNCYTSSGEIFSLYYPQYYNIFITS